MDRKEQERAVRQIRSGLTAIERLCLKLKGEVKRDLEVSPLAVDTLIDAMLKMCQQQRWLLLILEASGEDLRCPDCGSAEFKRGPRGGLAANIKCAGCGKVWWYAPGFGIREP